MNRRLSSLSATFCLAAVTALAGCSGASTADDDHTDDQYSSNQSTLLMFEFDGELVGSGGAFGDAKSLINDQMLYTIGHLNEHKSVGRLDKLELTNVKTTPGANGLSNITYHAKLPVSWGSKENLPTKYDFTLPRDASYEGQQKFTDAYMHSCVEFGAHDVDAGSMWYYYRPGKSGCTLAAGDVVKFTAKVSKSPENTTGKYPEYNKVWEDNALNVVAIFGKFEKGSTSDVGIDGFNNFVRAASAELRNYKLTTTPANVGDAPGAKNPDVTLSATLADGKKVTVTALLVDEITSATPAFWARYESVSGSADMISYNGHAGLGQNVRALAQRGKWVKGQYLVLFMNGCDTFAYVDGSLAQTRSRINTDDPTGTKYMEFVTNTMPSFFSSMPNASMSLFKGLMDHRNPKTYDQIFDSVDDSQIILVTGEEDNTYTPGGVVTPPTPGAWAGIDESFTVKKAEEKRFTTDTLPEGTYTFTLSGTGDGDLYVKAGTEPTTTSYDCRPYKNGSSELCSVSLKAPGKLSAMVRGYGATSDVKLVAAKK
ncbi:MAG: Alkaline serine protease [Myxococcaceae bacterium]|nr:Alkaline serine protease [Myxococcaceae bacterium]